MNRVTSRAGSAAADVTASGAASEEEQAWRT